MRYFSKQKFDKSRIVNSDGSLNEHSLIMDYVKKGSYYRPKTIEQYTDTLYGSNKHYLDFSIAKIKNYPTFIEVLNLVFNVDTAIVDTISIKRAIQKALNRDDEALKLDFDKYIRDLSRFEKEYYFFNLFNNQSENIDKALTLRDDLLTTEEKLALYLQKIKYRYNVESHLKIESKKIEEEYSTTITALIKKRKGRERIREKKIPSLQDRISSLASDIEKIEELREKYSKYGFEENSEIANTEDGITTALNSKNRQLVLLNEEKMSALESINVQIKDIEHKIKVTIPNEIDNKSRSLTKSEDTTYTEEKREINSQFRVDTTAIEELIKGYRKDITFVDNEISEVDTSFIENKKELQNSAELVLVELDNKKRSFMNKKKELSKKIEALHDENSALDRKRKDRTTKYETYLKDTGVMIKEKCVSFKKEIDTIENIIKTKAGTFKEYLSDNIVSWEKTLYPILDKNLLSSPTEILNPTIRDSFDSENLFGIELDISTLETIPTPEEAKEQIISIKREKKIFLQLAQEKMREEKGTFNIDLMDIASKKGENKKRVENIIEEIATTKKEILIIEEKEKETDSNLQKQIEEEISARDNKKENLGIKRTSLEDRIKKLKKSSKLKKMNSKEI